MFGLRGGGEIGGDGCSSSDVTFIVTEGVTVEEPVGCKDKEHISRYADCEVYFCHLLQYFIYIQKG